MSPARTGMFVQREMVASIRARWFMAYAAVFLVGGVLLVTLGLGDVAIHGYRGYARALAGLAHLALVFVPLMALFPATAAITDERERGGLEFILAQPVAYAEVYLGKWLGVGAAIVLAVTIGFGVPASLASLRGVPPSLLLGLYAFIVLLALAFVGLGLAVSGASSSRARAITTGLLIWLGLVAFGTLGVMVSFVRWGIPADLLAVWSFVNPIEAFRLGMITQLDPDFSLLGPVGAALIARLGSWGVAGLAAVSLVAWGVVPGLVGSRLGHEARTGASGSLSRA